jgi:hypothetical protein
MDLILVDFDEKVTNEAEIVALIKKVGYEAFDAFAHVCVIARGRVL